jgi:hypothetical protein
MSPFLHLAALIIASTAAVAAAIAAWSATSQWHWFWRALALWVCAAVLLPIRAYEPAIVLAMGLPLTVSVIRAAQRITPRPDIENRDSPLCAGLPTPHFLRFRLSTLLLATALLGLYLALLLHSARNLPDRQLLPRTTREIVVPIIAFVAIASLSSFVVSGPRRLWAALAVVAAIPALAWALWPDTPWLYAYDSALVYRELGIFGSHDHGYAFTVLGLAEFAALSLLCVAAVSLPRGDFSGARAVVALRFIFLAALGPVLAVLYVQMLWLSPFPPPLASPENHYARIMEIAQRVESLNPNTVALVELETTDPGAAKELSSLYNELLPLLKAPNAFVDDFTLQSERKLRDDAFTDRIKYFRALGRALDAEAAAAQGDFSRAAEFALADVRLGTMHCRNGLMVDAMVGNAVINHGAERLISIRHQLNPSLAQSIGDALGANDALFESPLAICQRDIAYGERSYGWHARFSSVLERITGPPQEPIVTKASFLAMFDRWIATSRLLQTDLAIRRYRHEQGRLPATLDDLVPSYLPQTPLDPFTLQPLIYRPTAPDFTLYSTGDDRIDNSGNFTNRKTYFEPPRSGYDFDLETLTRQ